MPGKNESTSAPPTSPKNYISLYAWRDALL